jgi:ElaB/YqjD/DUF883 family membrane-anchored ribosome-binding protein
MEPNSGCLVVAMVKRNRGGAQMNRDNLAGSFRSAIAQGETVVGNARDSISEGVDSISAIDFSALRDEVTKLTQMVSGLAQKQVSAGRDQVVSAMGAASDSLSQSAAMAQDKFTAVETDVESRIKKNPWGAVAIAGLVGLLIGKMS